MMADRKDHLDNLVLPNLQNGVWIISDRYLDSSYAYQGGGRQIDTSKIDLLTKLLNLPMPDLTLLFDLSPEMALERAKKRSELDRFESEPLAFHTRIRDAYKLLAQQDPNRFVLIDAAKNLESVQSQVQNCIGEFTK